MLIAQLCSASSNDVWSGVAAGLLTSDTDPPSLLIADEVDPALLPLGCGGLLNDLHLAFNLLNTAFQRVRSS